MSMSYLRISRILVATALASVLQLTSLVPLSVAQQDEGPSTAERTFDAVLLRPLGAMAVVLGGVLILPAALFAAPGGMESVDNAYDVFVRTPLDNLVNAPLGRDFGS